MAGIFILGFLLFVVYTIQKNVRAFLSYDLTVLPTSELADGVTNRLNNRIEQMEKRVGTWREFDITSLSSELSAYQTQGHQFIGPMTVDAGGEKVHIFDWHFAHTRRGMGISWLQTVIWFDLENRLVPSFNIRPTDLPLSVSIPLFERIDILGLNAEYKFETTTPSAAQRIFDQPDVVDELNAFICSDKWLIDRYENVLSFSRFNKIYEPDEMLLAVKAAAQMVASFENAAKNAEAALMSRVEA